MGFYAARFVEADSAETAIELAFELIRSEFGTYLASSPNHSLRADEVNVGLIHSGPVKGASWFEMEEEVPT